LSNGEGNSSLACAGWACEEEGASCHFFCFDEVDSHSCSLSGEDLANHTLGDLVGVTVFLESEAFDVSVGGDALGFSGGANLFDLDEGRSTLS
jgi:hypothetical protein